MANQKPMNTITTVNIQSKIKNQKSTVNRTFFHPQFVLDFVGKHFPRVTPAHTGYHPETTTTQNPEFPERIEIDLQSGSRLG